jgi:hypothetical protein
LLRRSAKLRTRHQGEAALTLGYTLMMMMMIMAAQNIVATGMRVTENPAMGRGQTAKAGRHGRTASSQRNSSTHQATRLIRLPPQAALVQLPAQ